MATKIHQKIHFSSPALSSIRYPNRSPITISRKAENLKLHPNAFLTRRTRRLMRRIVALFEHAPSSRISYPTSCITCSSSENNDAKKLWCMAVSFVLPQKRRPLPVVHRPLALATFIGQFRATHNVVTLFQSINNNLLFKSKRKR